MSCLSGELCMPVHTQRSDSMRQWPIFSSLFVVLSLLHGAVAMEEGEEERIRGVVPNNAKSTTKRERKRRKQPRVEGVPLRGCSTFLRPNLGQLGPRRLPSLT